VKRGLILEEEAEKSSDLIELDVRPLVVSIPHRIEELRLKLGLEFVNFKPRA
jgi:hypothetical protein